MPPTEEKPSYSTLPRKSWRISSGASVQSIKSRLAKLLPTSEYRVLIHRIGPTEDRDSIIFSRPE